MMKSIVIGTAGHIDHGKTALVKALTGTDTDRLPEEKARGITIDIGFAHMDLHDAQVSFVDVPGHERFIKNMLAGIGGIDLLFLVVAADESVMPQTREHFEICNLLGIRHGLIVITKKDLVDDETLGLVLEDVKDLVKGSFLEAAPVLIVSAKTGEGLESLKMELASSITRISQRRPTEIFRLPVDRVFVLKGHGTVITGTLLSGEIARDSAAEILPPHRRVRARSVHAHNHSVEKAVAGQRTAVNVIGVEKEEIERGDVLTEPGIFENTSLLDVQIQLLSGAFPLAHNAIVRFHHLTNDLLARVTLIGREMLEPGETCFAQLRLRRPIFALYNDRFILRKHSPLQTIGGGIILDHMPGRRLSRGNTEAIDRLNSLRNSPAERFLLAVEERGIRAADEKFLKAKLAMQGDTIRTLQHENVSVLKDRPLLALSRDSEQRMLSNIKERVTAFHEKNPLQPGIPKEELRSRFFPSVSSDVFDCLLQRAVQAKEVELQKDLVSLYGRTIRLSEQESNDLQRTEESLHNLGFFSTLDELKQKMNQPEDQLKKWLHLLVRQGKAVKITDDYFLHTDIWVVLKQNLRTLKTKQTSFSVPDFKTLFGVSRKYAIPLLERLDREGVTRRVGNERIIM